MIAIMASWAMQVSIRDSICHMAESTWGMIIHFETFKHIDSFFFLFRENKETKYYKMAHCLYLSENRIVLISAYLPSFIKWHWIITIL